MTPASQPGTGAPARHRITRGEAESILQAFGNGGRAVLQHSRVAVGAPADLLGSHGSIRPFSGSPWDGARLDPEDWHTIVVADIEGGDASFRHQDAVEIIDGLTIEFRLDGAELATTRTPIKPFADPGVFGLEVAYYAQQGRVMAPSDLAPGEHTLSVRITGPAGTFEDGIAFVVDATPG